MSTTWDCVIVGAGPAGLVAAWSALRSNRHARILVLEQGDKVGGRARTLYYPPIGQVPCGAGVGRVQKDARLAAWMRAMNVPVETWTSNKSTAFLRGPSFSLPQLLTRLRAAVKRGDARRTFQSFAQSVLSPPEWSWFQRATGFTDYLQADAWETVYNYGFEDVTEPLHGFTVPWSLLMDATHAMLEQAGVVFRFGRRVMGILQGSGYTTVRWQSHSRMSSGRGRAVIVATPVHALRTLFPQARAYKPNALNGQPFLRLYATLNSAGRAFMSSLTKWHGGFAMVDGPLQKVVAMDEAKGVYHLAYADNAHALALRGVMRRQDAKVGVTALVRYAFGAPPARTKVNYIKTWKTCEWFPTGTHYYPPLPVWARSRDAYLLEAQRPMPNVWVVGEAVSRDQGWTEGALQSVEAVWSEVHAAIHAK